MNLKTSSSLYTAIFVFFIDNFGFAIVYPLFGPLLLNRHYGILPAEISIEQRYFFLSLLFAAFPLAQFFGAPFFGNCADRWGRRVAYFYTIAGVALGYFLTGFFLLAKSYLGLLFSRLITGFFSGNQSISLAAIADLASGERERTKYFGINAGVSGVSWIGAILVGGNLSNQQLLDFFNPSVPFWIAGALTLLGLFCVARFFQETSCSLVKKKIGLLQGMHDIHAAFSQPKIRGLYFIYLCWTVAWFLVISWVTTVSLEKFKLSQAAIVWILIGNGIAWVVTNLLMGSQFIKYVKVIHLTLAAYLLCGICLILSMLANAWVFGFLFIAATACAGASWTASLSLISLISPEEKQGLSLGISQSLMAVGMFLGPLIAGGLSSYNISLPYLFSGALFLFGFSLLCWKRKYLHF